MVFSALVLLAFDSSVLKMMDTVGILVGFSSIMLVSL